ARDGADRGDVRANVGLARARGGEGRARAPAGGVRMAHDHEFFGDAVSQTQRRNPSQNRRNKKRCRVSSFCRFFFLPFTIYPVLTRYLPSFVSALLIFPSQT